MSLKLNGATSGSIELDVPAAIGSDLNITIPATAGEVAVKGTDGSVDLGNVNIDSSGRLLVGTSSSYSSDSLLQVVGPLGTGGQIVLANSYSLTSTSITFGLIRFISNAGSSSDTVASIYATNDGTHNAGDKPTRLVFSTTAATNSSPTERMRIDNLGTKFNYGTDSHVFFSNTSKGANTSDSIFYGRHSATGTTNGTICVIIRSNGQIENANGVYGTFSDIKLKENITNAHSQWDDIKKLRIVNYNYKPETNYDQHTQLGVIAQEVELFSPGLISEATDYDEEGNKLSSTTKSVKYSVLYMKAVKALQEAMERIETLETEMAAVKAQLS